MNQAPTPSIEDLACLLETAAGGDYHPGARDTVRWLIEQSAAGHQLYAELVAKPADHPSPLELARVRCGVTSRRRMREALPTAHWLIAQSELARALHDRLEQLAADAGAELGVWNRMRMLDYEHQLNRLYEAPDDWQHPSDLLDPTRFQGCDFPALYSLCRARIERSRGEPRRRLEEVRDKLERPAELDRLLPLFTRRFERLREWLRDVEDLETAIDSLEEMARLLRVAVESPAPE